MSFPKQIVVNAAGKIVGLDSADDLALVGKDAVAVFALASVHGPRVFSERDESADHKHETFSPEGVKSSATAADIARERAKVAAQGEAAKVKAAFA